MSEWTTLRSRQWVDKLGTASAVNPTHRLQPARLDLSPSNHTHTQTRQRKLAAACVLDVTHPVVRGQCCDAVHIPCILLVYYSKLECLYAVVRIYYWPLKRTHLPSAEPLLFMGKFQQALCVCYRIQRSSFHSSSTCTCTCIVSGYKKS